MLSTSTIHPALLRALPSDGGAPNHGADPAGFSSLLRQSQASAPPPQLAPRPPAPSAAAKPPTNDAPNAPERHDASAGTETGETEGSAPSPESADAPDAATRSRGTPRAKARDAQPRSARSDGAPADAAPPTASAEASATPATDAAGATPASIDPQIAQWLAAQQRPAPGEKTAKADTAGASAEGSSAAKTGAADTANVRGTDADTDAAKSVRGAGPDRAEPATAFAAVLAERASAEPAPSSHAASAAGPIGALAGAATPATAARETAAPTVVSLPTPVDAPEFAQALGVQLSVFAKDGVQRAELHLNPAEMGPVSVQIVMEGTQARIDFGADVAATRNAIEAGLPELASALRDAGFTLAGGGVSQQSAGQRGDGGQTGHDGSARAAARAVSDEGLERVVAAARRIVAPGGVDLYA